MADCEISNDTFFETVHASFCRSTTLSLSGCDKEASSFLEHVGDSTDPKLHWFWKIIHERKVSLRDLNRDAFQYSMRCKVLQWVKGYGILQMENAMILQHITQLPYLGEWMRMVSKGSYDNLQTYMDQQAGYAGCPWKTSLTLQRHLFFLSMP